MTSVRERLAAELEEAMVDHVRVRQRFDSLPRAQQGFLMGLLVRDRSSGTVTDVRGSRHGRAIEDFEVEGVLKNLHESGYIVRTAGSGGYSSEVFTIPEELAGALRRTVAVEDRQPMEMLSLRQHLASPATNGNGSLVRSHARPLEDMRDLADPELRGLLAHALEGYGGILTRSEVSQARASDGALPLPASLNRASWRKELEARRLGTTGILSLKDYGIELEEEGLLVFQEHVYEAKLEEARKPTENDREVSSGVDLIIDLDRLLEVLRRETVEITREGHVYKKIEEKIAAELVTHQHPEFHDGSPVNHVIDLGRRLHFFEEEGQRMTVDPLRRRVWRNKPLVEKVNRVFDVYRGEKRGQRWSFHQTAIREIFLEHLLRVAPGNWLGARAFLAAVIAKYLLELDARKVGSEFHERCTGNFKNETLVVPLHKLHRDLSYWVFHRLALLGLVDVGFRDGAFHSFKLSRLGARHFTGQIIDGKAGTGPRCLVNPDFEILIYPECPEEVSWTASQFADRLDSEQVKRFRLTRDSLKRGIVAGLTLDEILGFLEQNARGGIPPNVLYSLREWTSGVELVRLQKVQLLRAQSPAGASKLAQILESREIPFERLNETTVMIRGGKNEKAVRELKEHFRDHGLFVE